MSDLLNLLDAHIGGVSAPAHASTGPLYLPAPLRATYEDVRAAQGPTYTVSLTPEVERYMAARREAYDAAVSQVVVAYRADTKPGNTWERREAAMARITATVPNRALAEERAASDVATAVQDECDSVLNELRALYPND